LMLTSEFSSLEEPTEVSEGAVVVVLWADELKEIGSERQRVPKDPTWKLKLSIARFISWLRFPKIRIRVGGFGRKSTETKKRFGLRQLSSCFVMQMKMPSNPWIQRPRSPRSVPIDVGESRQCPRWRTLDRGKRASDKLKGKDQTNKAELVILLR
jgi:hypothetical protein